MTSERSLAHRAMPIQGTSAQSLLHPAVTSVVDGHLADFNHPAIRREFAPVGIFGKVLGNPELLADLVARTNHGRYGRCHSGDTKMAYRPSVLPSDHPAMTAKLKIVGALGEDALLLPALVNGALDANNRAKYFFSLLQSARGRADHLERPFSSLREERLASCVDQAELDQVVGASRRNPEGPYLIPHSEEIVEYTVAAIREMITPLEAVAGGEVATGYLERFQVLSGTVAAFMQGVNRTAPLKFDHPGLGTTAARSGGVIVIQNDIGTTNAHVLVSRVAGLTVTTLYSDVHLHLFDALILTFQGHAPQPRFA